MKEDDKISKVKHQWGKSQRDTRGGARYLSLPNKKPPPQEPRKKREAPRIAANTVEKQDSTPLDATAQLMDSSA